jgi:hypothetical protein
MKESAPYRTINGKKDRYHRHLMEEVIGRELTSEEHVFHINGNPFDNRIENLIIIKKRKRNVR